MISSQIQVSCYLTYSKESSISSGSRAITPYSKISQRNFHFQGNIHIEYCPTKFFTISSLINQFKCSLVCSNEACLAAWRFPLSNTQGNICLLWMSSQSLNGSSHRSQRRKKKMLHWGLEKLIIQWIIHFIFQLCFWFSGFHCFSPKYCEILLVDFPKVFFLVELVCTTVIMKKNNEFLFRE